MLSKKLAWSGNVLADQKVNALSAKRMCFGCSRTSGSKILLDCTDLTRSRRFSRVCRTQLRLACTCPNLCSRSTDAYGTQRCRQLAGACATLAIAAASQPHRWFQRRTRRTKRGLLWCCMRERYCSRLTAVPGSKSSSGSAKMFVSRSSFSFAFLNDIIAYAAAICDTSMYLNALGFVFTLHAHKIHLVSARPVTAARAASQRRARCVLS